MTTAPVPKEMQYHGEANPMCSPGGVCCELMISNMYINKYPIFRGLLMNVAFRGNNTISVCIVLMMERWIADVSLRLMDCGDPW